MWFFTSPKIAFGEDSLEQLSAIEGKRALVITDPIVSKLGMLEVVTNELKKEPRAVEVFDQVENDCVRSELNHSLPICHLESDLDRLNDPWKNLSRWTVHLVVAEMIPPGPFAVN